MSSVHAAPVVPVVVPSQPAAVLHWRDLPWALWNMFIFYGIYKSTSSDTLSPYWLVFRLTAGTAILRLFPPPLTTAFPFAANFVLLSLIKCGYAHGGAWSFLCLFIVFGVLPTNDMVVGLDKSNPEKELEASLSRSWAFRVITFLVVPASLYIIAWGCWAASQPGLAWYELLGLAMSVGVYTGGIGITVSHELSHKGTKLEQWLGRVLVVAVSYGHFYVEHVMGHHKHIGCSHDPATSRMGESFYSFLPRVLRGEWSSAWSLELARVKSKNLPWWHNEMYWYSSCSIAFAAALTRAFGLKALAFFVAQSCMAVLLFELVNYLEHYGLERCKDSNGEYEDVSALHSWDSCHLLTNVLLFKLQRHADHHTHGGKRYQCLRVDDASPQLPSGYPGMILLALVPPLWRRVMHPRLMRHRAAVTARTGQRWTFGDQPAPEAVAACAGSKLKAT